MQGVPLENISIPRNRKVFTDELTEKGCQAICAAITLDAKSFSNLTALEQCDHPLKTTATCSTEGPAATVAAVEVLLVGIRKLLKSLRGSAKQARRAEPGAHLQDLSARYLDFAIEKCNIRKSRSLHRRHG